MGKHLSTTRARVAAALAYAALYGGCTLSAEGEIPDVEVVQHNLAFPAAPPEADGTDVSLSVPFRMRPARLGIPKAAFSEVRVLSVSMLATSGVPDLAFLRSVRLTVSSAEATAAGQPAVEVARYERIAGGEPGTFLLVESAPPVDVTEIWKSTQVVFLAEVVGQLPTVKWTADIGIRFGASLKY